MEGARAVARRYLPNAVRLHAGIAFVRGDCRRDPASDAGTPAAARCGRDAGSDDDGGGGPS
jgi:hypothetical protein